MASSPPNFERSISLNDLDSSLRVRELIKEDIISPEDEKKHCHLKYSSEFTFVLKSFKDLALDFKKFLYSYLLDVGIYKELEENKELNWCPSLFPMVPVLTLGDGNCLMHAASIGMWAVNDRYHTLRKLVYDAILEDTEGRYYMIKRCLEDGCRPYCSNIDKNWVHQTEKKFAYSTNLPTMLGRGFQAGCNYLAVIQFGMTLN